MFFFLEFRRRKRATAKRRWSTSRCTASTCAFGAKRNTETPTNGRCSSSTSIRCVLVDLPSILPSFSEFCLVLPSSTGFYLVLPSFSGFYLVLLDFTQQFTQFYLVLLSFTQFFWVLPSFSGFYLVLLGFTQFYWVFTQFCWVLLSSLRSFTESYWALSSFFSSDSSRCHRLCFIQLDFFFTETYMTLYLVLPSLLGFTQFFSDLVFTVCAISRFIFLNQGLYLI